MADHNLSGGKAAKEAALKTRKPKSKIKPSELALKWRETAAAVGWTENAINKIVGKSLQREVQHQVTAGIALDDTFLGKSTISPIPQLNATSAKLIIPPVLALSWKTSLPEKPHEDPFPAAWNHFPVRQRFENEKLPQPKSDPVSLKAFRTELRKSTDRIFPENQTRRKIEKIAFKIGSKLQIPSKQILEGIDDLKLPYQKFLFRIEWKPIFPSAPHWNPASKIRTPRIVVFNKPRKWGEIHYSMPIPAFFGPKKEFRIQETKIISQSTGLEPVFKVVRQGDAGRAISGTRTPRQNEKTG